MRKRTRIIFRACSFRKSETDRDNDGDGAVDMERDSDGEWDSDIDRDSEGDRMRRYVQMLETKKPI